MNNSQNDEQGWQGLFETEIRQAYQARSRGNEGKARVCSRRAAGLAAGEYLQRSGIEVKPASAINYLRCLAALPNLTAQAQEVTGKFLQHVDQDFKLPDQVDLIADALWLARQLLGYPGSSDIHTGN